MRRERGLRAFPGRAPPPGHPDAPRPHRAPCLDLCFGTGYLSGPSVAGARLLTRAYDRGVTFWDTSDDYGTDRHVARALRELGRRHVVVATKTYATTALGARRAMTRRASPVSQQPTR